jgi:hypothetical protein
MIQVKVYWNLHKRCFSIQHRGKVIAHKNEVVIHFPEFKVSEAGRQRVLREKRKNVHGFIIGFLEDNPSNYNINDKFRVIYNPYKYISFVFMDTEESVFQADLAICKTSDGKPQIFI